MIAEYIAVLEKQLERVNERCEKAFRNWDEEAYEGAIESGNKIYKQIQDLKEQQNVNKTNVVRS